VSNGKDFFIQARGLVFSSTLAVSSFGKSKTLAQEANKMDVGIFTSSSSLNFVE